MCVYVCVCMHKSMMACVHPFLRSPRLTLIYASLPHACIPAQGTVGSVSDALDTLLMVHDKTHALANDLIDHCLEAERRFLEATRGGRGGAEDDAIDEEEGPAAAPGGTAAAAAAGGPAAAAGGGRGKAAGAAAGAASSSRSQEALRVSSYVKIQFAELFVGQRDSYLEKEVSLLRLRLVDGLAAQAGEGSPGLTGRLDERGGHHKGATGGGGGGRRSLLEKMRAAGQEPPDLPALRHERIESYDQMLEAWLRREVRRSAVGRSVCCGLVSLQL